VDTLFYKLKIASAYSIPFQNRQNGSNSQ